MQVCADPVPPKEEPPVLIDLKFKLFELSLILSLIYFLDFSMVLVDASEDTLSPYLPGCYDHSQLSLKLEPFL